MAQGDKIRFINETQSNVLLDQKTDITVSESIDDKIVSTAASSVLLSGDVALADSELTKNFAAVTYTGNGSSQDIVTGIDSVDFTQPSNGSGYYLDRSSKQGVVVDLGSDGETDDVHTYTPSVINDSGTYKMWYSGHDGTNVRIHYATSADGINWSKQGVVVPLGTNGESDDAHTYYPSVINDSGTYKMWYAGDDGTNVRIHYATSNDGITWSKQGVVVPLGTNGESDDARTYTPSVINDSGTYKMWYSGHDGSNIRIHYATSNDGVTWSKQGVVVPLGSSDETDVNSTYAPSVINDSGTYKMWYSGHDGSNIRIHYAELKDGYSVGPYVISDAGEYVSSGTCDWGTNRGVSKVHIKSRSYEYNNIIHDGLRGGGRIIHTDAVASESIYLANTLTGFNANGFSLGDGASWNNQGDTYIAYQTLYTHIKWGTTNQGKFYVEAYNPVTNEGMIYYIGSGLAGHEIPHSMGIELDFGTVKNLSATAYWQASLFDGNGGYLNATNAFYSNGIYLADNSSINIGSSGSEINASNNEYITYYKTKSETFTIGQYTGTGVAGNFIETKDVNSVARKPRRVIVKRIDDTGSWLLFDSERGGYPLFLDLTNSEEVTTYLEYLTNGMTLGNNIGVNASGGQYLYLVEFDTNSDGGDSYFDYPTDDTNLNITSGKFTFTDGIGDNGYNVSTENFTGSIDFTGVSDGIKWIGRTKDTSWVFEDKKPMFSMYEKESADDNRLVMVDGNWYNTTGGELVTNGTFDTDTSGWAFAPNWDNTGCSFTQENGSIKLNTGTGNYCTVAQQVTCVVGAKYKVEAYTSGYEGVVLVSDDGTYSTNYGNAVGANSNISFTFVATSTNPYIVIYSNTITDNEVSYFDNISVYKLEPTLGTAVTEPISFLPKPYQVASETPQAEMREFDALPEVVGKVAEFEEVTVNGKLRPKGGVEVYAVDTNYIDIDAIGANPQATLWSDGTITGSTDNGSYTKYPNGDLECRCKSSSFTTSVAISPVYVNDTILLSYPAEFVQTPQVISSAKITGGQLIGASTYSTTTLKTNGSIYSHNATSTGCLLIVAFGKWR
jgi:predicted GH43/DUF377 family glycosyl hydrolase